MDKIKVIALNDPRVSLINIKETHTEKDPNHLERRMAQRAINNEMIKVCIAYGNKAWRYGAEVYTLGDRQLNGTKYEKYAEKLRGLTVVTNKDADDAISVITACWKF